MERSELNWLKKDFFNNLNYEVRKYYYTKDNIIDYDILDYINFKSYTKNNTLYVEVIIELRLITLKNNKIKSKIIKENFIMKKNTNETLE